MSAIVTYAALAFSLVVENFYVAPLLGKDNEDFFKLHTIIQSVIFICVAMIPAYQTGVMWYVDVAWPLGLIFIGAHVMYSLAHNWKGYAIACCVLFQGLRMFMGACVLVSKGIWKSTQEI